MSHGNWHFDAIQQAKDQFKVEFYKCTHTFTNGLKHWHGAGPARLPSKIWYDDKNMQPRYHNYLVNVTKIVHVDAGIYVSFVVFNIFTGYQF